MPSSRSSFAPTAAEGSRREQLAAYFLSAPPIPQQTPAQRETYFARLREMGQLETDEILQSAGSTRPLLWGNPVPLMQNLLTAAQQLAAGLGQPLFVFPAKETAIDFYAMLHPRILSLGLTGLLRAACLAAPHQPVWVRMQEQERCLTVTVTAAAPPVAKDSLQLIQESARLHGGSLALCESSVAFSIGRAAEIPPGARPYVCPTAAALLRDSLSAVWTGFYGWLYPSLSSPGSTKPDTSDGVSSSSSSTDSGSSSAPSGGSCN